jgi:hypothetical protein
MNKAKMTEHDEQAALIQWADTLVVTGRVPELACLFAIPNGAQTKNYLMGNKLVQEGLKKGIPDLFLAYPNSEIHGLFVEMKFGKNKLSREQFEWKDRLIDSGYQFITCWSWIDAARLILDYLGYDLKDFPEMQIN